MSWDNFDDDFLEFAKFWPAKKNEHMFDKDDEVMVIYIHIESVKLVEFVNRWNKTQYKIKVKIWETQFNTGTSKNSFWLAGGKRLFGNLKKFVLSEIRDLKILRIGKGFDTQYFITEFKNAKRFILDEFNSKQKST